MMREAGRIAAEHDLKIPAEEVDRSGGAGAPGRLRRGMSRGPTIIGPRTRDKAQPAAKLGLTSSVMCFIFDRKPHRCFL